MRLFLDAHVSGRRIARALRDHGHDVRAADEERELDGWEDERLLELATAEGRIMVTFNVKDFARLLSQWGAGATAHAGCLLIVGLDRAEFGLALRVIQAALEGRPDQALDLTRFRGHLFAGAVGLSERRPSATNTTPIPARVPS